MTTNTIFILVPTHFEDPTSFVTVSAHKFHANAMEIAPALGCKYVERFKCRVGPTGPIKYAWVDEEGHVYGKPINQRCSRKLYPGLLAGPVAIQIGDFDLTNLADARKWDLAMARIGPELRAWGIDIPAQVSA